MENFYKTNLEEQETIINIDYFDKTVHIYTCRKSVYERLKNKLGEPNKIYYLQGKICGGSWKIPFVDKSKINNALSRPILIGQMK